MSPPLWEDVAILQNMRIKQLLWVGIKCYYTKLINIIINYPQSSQTKQYDISTEWHYATTW